ncbi:MAG: hypothetical protein A3A73_01415 [Omnitrophica bacterium RIFCSPLOWO2_01_FULL_50_24]|nr:MAG: hypothetical protein A3A73_01415 [Omnitrophica bacterium RIFCSPLOWO2_01_FULL_50_24]
MLRASGGDVWFSAGRALGRTSPLGRAAVGRLEQRYRTVGSALRGRRSEAERTPSLDRTCHTYRNLFKVESQVKSERVYEKTA